MRSDTFLCADCSSPLTQNNEMILCASCNKEWASVKNGMVVFGDVVEKTDFFEKQAVQRLGEKYKDFNREEFERSLTLCDLPSMDLLNKKVGITQKKWWERHIGIVSGKNVLEVGCGVNYLVPYWLSCDNNVTAFDICEESVLLMGSVLQKLDFNTGAADLFVGDAERVRFNKKFDCININNVLHHIKDKQTVLKHLSSCLTDDGVLLIVEPNYYYPMRWIVETDRLDPFNLVKQYFVRNNLIEAGEKAVKFKALKKTITDLGLTIRINEKDPNYLGYAISYFIDRSTIIPKALYAADRFLISKILPRLLAPFEYLIVSRS